MVAIAASGNGRFRTHERLGTRTPKCRVRRELERFTYGLQTEIIPDELTTEDVGIGAEGDIHGPVLERPSRARRGGSGSWRGLPTRDRPKVSRQPHVRL